MYDVTILPFLFETIKKSTREYFVLSHIPRANVNEERAVGTEDEIRLEIVEEGRRKGVRYLGEWRREGKEGSVMIFDVIK